MHLRSAVRKYAIKLLKDNVDVGKKVFPNRPSPIFASEVPCILVYFAAEPTDIIVGDQYNPTEYKRNLRLNIDILNVETVNPAADINENTGVEDILDTLAWEVENAMADDYQFAKNLKGYEPNKQYASLLLGSRIVSTDPYNIDLSGEERIVAQRIQYELPYETPNYLDKKYPYFTDYYAQFNYVKDGVDTGEILLEAEGKLKND